MKRKIYTDDFKAKIVSRIQRGESVSSLQKETGVSMGTLHSWKNASTPTRSTDENTRSTNAPTNGSNQSSDRAGGFSKVSNEMNTELLNLAIAQLNTHAIAGVSITRTGLSVHFALPTTQENF